VLQTTPNLDRPNRAVQKHAGLEEINCGFPSFSGTLFFFFFVSLDLISLSSEFSGCGSLAGM